MSLRLARYKNIAGYVTYIPNSNFVGFKTNTGYYKVLESELQDGKYLLPIPFYGNREFSIIRQQQNGAFIGTILDSRTHAKKLNVGYKDITWYILDSTHWDSRRRQYVKTKYGLSNFEITTSIRNNL